MENIIVKIAKHAFVIQSVRMYFSKRKRCTRIAMKVEVFEVQKRRRAATFSVPYCSAG